MKLFPYQVEDVDRALRFVANPQNNYSAYLGHEPGLGKTLIAKEIRERILFRSSWLDRTLIICPSSAKWVWHSQQLKTTTKQVIEKCSDILKNGLVTIVSFDLAISPQISTQLLLREWDLLIVDEAHNLGSFQSKRSKLILSELFPKCRYKLFLSGSISRNRPIQLWPIFRTIAPKLIPPYWEFAHKYCWVKQNKWGKRVMGAKSKEAAIALGELAEKNFLIRRLKKDVLPQLPSKLYQVIKITIPGCDRLQEAARDFGEEARRLVDDGAPPSGEISTARKELGIKKVPFIVEYLEDLLNEINPTEDDWRINRRKDIYVDNPVVVFCYHKEVYQQLRSRLSHLKLEGFSSETSSKERAKTIERFQKGIGNIFLCTYAASEAITLTRASYLVRGELAWSRSMNEQAVDRVHRVGQKNQVYIKDIIAENTLDEIVYNGLKQKLREHQRMFG